MTNLEFSREFDILYNNIMSNSAPGLTEYDKSVLLTQAQESLIKMLYGNSDSSISFEIDEKTRKSLDELVNSLSITNQVSSNMLLTDHSVVYQIPENAWFVIFEEVIISSNDCNNGKRILVVPVTHDEFYKINENPFRNANDRRCLRLNQSFRCVELICKYDISSYFIRYIKRPSPIILTDLIGDLSINGYSAETECELNEVVHRDILNLAIQLAKQISFAMPTSNK
ncbi:MAG: hypothetical protein LBM96_05780 [Methanobrevibacter sp.]|jgi:hypothetical protein|nr:hypothetical protein [Candidatus Methanoflexus mossambicus]